MALVEDNKTERNAVEGTQISASRAVLIFGVTSQNPPFSEPAELDAKAYSVIAAG